MIPLEVVLVWSVGVSLVLGIIYRALTKPEEMRRLKKDIKFFQEKQKKAMKDGDKKEADKQSSEMIKLQGKMMKLNMKPMIFSILMFIVTIYVIGGQFGIVSYFGQQGGIISDLEGGKGSLVYSGVEMDISVFRDGDELKARIGPDEEIVGQGGVIRLQDSDWILSLEDERVRAELAVVLPFPIPLAGTHLHWFWWYVLITVPVTMIFRKLLGAE